MTTIRNIGEVERTRGQMLRVGPVVEVDKDACRFRVLIEDKPTKLIPLLNIRGGEDRAYWVPVEDEQVIVFCPDGEPSNGVILGGVYRDKYPQPRDWDEHATVYRDTAVTQYNPHTGVYHIELPEEVWEDSEADEDEKKGPMVVITAPKIMFRGQVLFNSYPGSKNRAFSDEEMVEKDRADEPDFAGSPCPPGCQPQ